MKPDIIFNFDYTQYLIDTETSNIFMCIEVENNEARTANGAGKLLMREKLWHLHDAVEYSAEPIYVVAVSFMNDNEFKYNVITVLSNNSSVYGFC